MAFDPQCLSENGSTAYVGGHTCENWGAGTEPSQDHCRRCHGWWTEDVRKSGEATRGLAAATHTRNALLQVATPVCCTPAVTYNLRSRGTSAMQPSLTALSCSSSSPGTETAATAIFLRRRLDRPIEVRGLGGESLLQSLTSTNTDSIDYSVQLYHVVTCPQLVFVEGLRSRL
ncbi:hypothetical protein VTG60DRAFT_4048 [Thermothelomyces hinnuleus]